MTPEEIALDDRLWYQMDEVHAEFIASQMSDLSKNHFDDVTLFSNVFSIPKWSGRNSVKDNSKVTYASNLSVICNDIYSIPHEYNNVTMDGPMVCSAILSLRMNKYDFPH